MFDNIHKVYSHIIPCVCPGGPLTYFNDGGIRVHSALQLHLQLVLVVVVDVVVVREECL